mmetsp:Transcript_37753/g.38425  ORF Transcript_37753/g.38425 Transcript_37753/m.38425 type:complete len:121 (-) Transcript_37753:217-579(-)
MDESLARFSRWTLEVTGEYMMVVDLQGARVTLRADSFRADRASEKEERERKRGRTVVRRASGKDETDGESEEDFMGSEEGVEGFVLTDPAVLCVDVTRFGPTNLGRAAMLRCNASLSTYL